MDQFQFAGYYVAKEKGFYQDAGLDVEIIKFDPKKLAINEVMAVRSTYGIDRSSLLIDRMKGKKIMMTEDFQDTISVRAMLNSQGIGMDDLTFLEHSYNPLDLANGKTDVMACYISNEPFVLKRTDLIFTVIFYLQPNRRSKNIPNGYAHLSMQ